MGVDWIGFGYAAAIAFGGFMGYKRKGLSIFILVQNSTKDSLHTIKLLND